LFFLELKIGGLYQRLKCCKQKVTVQEISRQCRIIQIAHKRKIGSISESSGKFWGAACMPLLEQEHDRKSFAVGVREKLAKLGWSRETLAREAQCTDRTVGNVLAGKAVRDITLGRIANVLGLEVRAKSAARIADEDYGGYSFEAYRHLMGTYFLYRRPFTKTEAPSLYRTIVEIDWDEDRSCFSFGELQKHRISGENSTIIHEGVIYISILTNLVHVLTIDRAAVRTITLNNYKFNDRFMRGLMMTQSDRVHFYQPSVAAVLLQKQSRKFTGAEAQAVVGFVTAEKSEYASIESELKKTEQVSVCISI
jgi:ribosome-binding protein aMBF1 (putative translation factor)